MERHPTNLEDEDDLDLGQDNNLPVYSNGVSVGDIVRPMNSVMEANQRMVRAYDNQPIPSIDIFQSNGLSRRNSSRGAPSGLNQHPSFPVFKQAANIP